MNTSEVLNTAADLIEERGWMQGPAGWITRDAGPLCLEGGIIAALGSEWHRYRHEFETCPAYRAVETYLGRNGSWLWSWNDAFERTAEEVIATLRAAAVIEAAKENAEIKVSA